MKAEIAMGGLEKKLSGMLRALKFNISLKTIIGNYD